jgi:hypothetical protein
MQELDCAEVEQVAGGLAFYYYTPPAPYNNNVLSDIQAGSRAAGEYDNPNPLDWAV